MSSRKTSSVAAGAIIFSVGMLMSRFLGLLRENLLQQTFGNSDTTGAFKLAFMVPDLFYYLLAGGAMSAAFIPVFVSYLSKGKDEEAHKVGSTIATFLLIAMSICVAICMIFAPAIFHLLPASRKFTPEAFNLTVSLTRIMCVMLIFTAQSGHLTGILNSYKHFVAPVVVWNVYTLASLFGITVLTKLPLFGGSPQHPNIHGVAYGVLLGAFLLAAIQFPVAIRHGFRFTFMLDFAHEGVQQVFKLFVPVMVSLSLSQVNILMIPQVMGSNFGLPAVNDINNANKLVMLPFSLFAAAIGTAVFPTLAQQATNGENSAFRETLSKAMKMILILSIPSAVGLLVLADPLSCLLYGGGRFGMQGIQATSYVLQMFAWAVVGLGLAQVVNRAFYSLHDTITPTIVSIAMVVGNFAFSWYLASFSHFKYGSVAIATTITSTVSTVVLVELLRKRLKGIGGRSLLTMTLKVLFASALMGVAVYYIAAVLSPVIDGNLLRPVFRWDAPFLPFSVNDMSIQLNLSHLSRLKLLIQVGVSMCIGMGIYAFVLWGLGVKELKLITDRFTAKLRRKRNLSVV
ncbi:MAG TPA: murein biosynthesis integral membrane protein MurJ [Armatimonadota bacterium]|nr:murein biosynthesis integral membrane protein MurJ [Armatimonadota bacterium]